MYDSSPVLMSILINDSCCLLIDQLNRRLPQDKEDSGRACTVQNSLQALDADDTHRMSMGLLVHQSVLTDSSEFAASAMF